MAVSKAEQTKFSQEIHKIKKERECGFLAAIQIYCELKNVEFSNKILKLFNKSLMDKVTAEARGLKLIKSRRKKK